MLLINKLWCLTLNSCFQISSYAFWNLILLFVSFTYIIHMIIRSWWEIWLRLGLSFFSMRRNFLNSYFYWISDWRFHILERMFCLTSAPTQFRSFFRFLPFLEFFFKLIFFYLISAIIFQTRFFILVFHLIFHLIWMFWRIFLHDRAT
jgi:hypothetical protein